LEFISEDQLTHDDTRNHTDTIIPSQPPMPCAEESASDVRGPVFQVDWL